MIIKLTKVVDSKLGKHPAKEIHGEKVGTNEPWKKAFFANNKEIKDKLNEFEMGDIINVVMEKVGDYYNIADIKEASDDDIANAEKYTKKSSAPTGGGGAGFVRRPDGGSRGDDTNRSAAVYLARDILNTTIGAWGETSKMTPEFMAAYATQLANAIILPYIKDGVVAEIKPLEKPKAGRAKKDPLEPPQVED